MYLDQLMFVFQFVSMPHSLSLVCEQYHAQVTLIHMPLEQTRKYFLHFLLLSSFTPPAISCTFYIVHIKTATTLIICILSGASFFDYRLLYIDKFCKWNII